MASRNVTTMHTTLDPIRSSRYFMYHLAVLRSALIVRSTN